MSQRMPTTTARPGRQASSPAFCLIAALNGLDEDRIDGQCVLQCAPLSGNQATVWITSLPLILGGNDAMDRRSFLTRAGVTASVAATFPSSHRPEYPRT